MVHTGYKNLRHCLVIDDDEDLREALAMTLESFGLSCVMAANGREALEALQVDLPDLVLTDYRMPLMDGMAVLAWCRKQKIHLPVILLTADADLIDANRVALGDCCATVLQKPLDLERFRVALDAADKRQHHQDCVHRRQGAG